MILPHDAPLNVTALQSRMIAAVRAHWKAFLVEGILLALLGLGAIVIPPLASLAVTIFLGWIFLVSGILGLITSVAFNEIERKLIPWKAE